MNKLQKLLKQRGKLNLQIEWLNKKKKGYKCYSRIKLKNALKRTWKVTAQSKGKDRISCRIYLPVCFKDKKVKLRLK